MNDPIYVELKERNGNLVKKEIRFDINAISAFEKKTGYSFMDMMSQMAQSFEQSGEQGILKVLSVDMLRCAIWAGLLWRPNVRKPLTIEQVGSMMSLSMQDLVGYATVVMNGMMGSLGAGQKQSQELSEATNENFTSAGEPQLAPASALESTESSI